MPRRHAACAKHREQGSWRGQAAQPRPFQRSASNHCNQKVPKPLKTFWATPAAPASTQALRRPQGLPEHGGTTDTAIFAPRRLGSRCRPRRLLSRQHWLPFTYSGGHHSMPASRASSSSSRSNQSAWATQTTGVARSATRPAAPSTSATSAPHSSSPLGSTGSTRRPPASSGIQLAPRTSLPSWTLQSWVPWSSSTPADSSSLQQPLLSSESGAESQTATQSPQLKAPPSKGEVLFEAMARMDSLAKRQQEALPSYTGEGREVASLASERVRDLQTAAATNLRSQMQGGDPSRWDDKNLADAVDWESKVWDLIGRTYGGGSTASSSSAPRAP